MNLAPARAFLNAWAPLLALSAAVSAALTLAGLPAALLLGPLLAGMAVAFRGESPRIPRPAFLFAQGVVGCMIADALPASLAPEAAGDWPIFIFGVLAVLALSSALSLVFARLGILPGATAAWGMSPGAASAMTLMAENYGADARMVALMQYTRVLFVAAIAPIVASAAGGGDGHGLDAAPWFPAISRGPFAATLALAAAGPLIARLTGWRSAPLLVPLFAGGALIHFGLLEMELPRWLLAASYAAIGWSIGLRFSRPMLLSAARALPGIAVSALTLIAACGVLAAALVHFAEVDPLTAYLATTPGGADSIAIIAASSPADAPFVITMQMTRFFVILLLGPFAARLVAARIEAAAGGAAPPAE